MSTWPRANKLQGPVSLYLLTLGESGERKSTVDGFFTGAIREYERQQAEEAKPALEQYASDASKWNAKREGLLQAIKQASKAGKAATSRELELAQLDRSRPVAPRVPKLLRGDDTPENLAFQLVHGWPASGVLSSEAAVIFGWHGMGEKSVTRNLGLLNVLWDGGTHDVGRRTSESFTVRGARFTTALMVQDAVLRDFNQKAGALARGSGYWARFLICWPESTQGTRLFREPPDQWPALAKFNQRLEQLLQRDVPLSEDGTLQPTLPQLTPEAKQLWVEFHDAIERQLAPEGELHDVRDVASKVADNAARLAALFQVFTDGLSDISAEKMESGCRLAAWHLSEAQRFFGELAIPPGTLAAMQLERWLKAHCNRHQVIEVSRREVQRLITPSYLRDGETLTAAVATLAQHGRVREHNDDGRKVIEVRSEVLSA
jgi:putative DNA primase/helicase